MKRKTISLVTLLLVAMISPVAAGPGAPTPGAITPIRSEISLLLELHNHLLVASKGPESALPEYSLEVAAYRQAQAMAKDPAVWQIVNDACVVNREIAGLGATAAGLPTTLHPADREASQKVFSALESAWPRFESRDMVDRNRSLQTVVSKTLRRQFNGGPVDRVLVTLQDKMILKPLDAPVTIYPVISAVEAGAWGKTPQGYYIVIPVRGRPMLILTENIVHELTHLLDVNQVQGSLSMLTRLRQKAAGSDPAAVEAFLHGLVAWNAGEMIKRFINPGHKAVVDLSPQTLMKMEPYLPIYNGVWIAYLDGKTTADQTVEAMITAFNKVPVPKPVSGQ